MMGERHSSILIISLLFVVFWCYSYGVYAQRKALNIPGIHQLVGDSKAENIRQKAALERQARNTINEQANKTLLFKVKDSYRLLQSRFSILAMAVSAAEVGLNAAPLISKISRDQALLLNAAGRDPALLALVYQVEIEFLLKAKDLSAFLIGLSLSIGPLNQMKISERKLLFDHVLAELRAIAALSAGMVRIFQNSNLSILLLRMNPFADYLETDKRVVEDILRNAKILGL